MCGVKDKEVTEAKVLSGKEISKKIKEGMKEEVQQIKEKNSEFAPGLTIVQVGDREDSNVYVRMKMKTATELGFKPEHVKVSKNASQSELVNLINSLNADKTVHGIIVQLPLDTDEEIDTTKVINSVLPTKDVDCLNEVNTGKLAHGDLKGFLPCTPHGCMTMIEESGIELQGKRAVVVGRSKIVGMPMSMLLTWANATVTICHSRTQNLEDIVREADVLVAACGRPKMIKGSWIKQGAIVIDCGINSIEDASRKSGRRLVGDVDYDEAKRRASYITPVPGGVGPMTVCMLMKNTLESAKRHLNLQDEKREEAAK